MTTPGLSSKKIRLPILFLTVLTITPIIFLILYLNFQQLDRSKKLQINNLKNISQLVATEHFQIVEGARQLLISLSISPEIEQSSFLCHKFLLNLLSQYKRYSNFIVTDAKGNVICSAVEVTYEVNISDRFSFQQTVSSKGFTIGEFMVSKITNKAALNFGYPLLDNKGNITGAVFSSLDLSWLNNLVANFELDKNMDLMVLDRNGTVLASNSDPNIWTGKSLPRDPLVKSLSSQTGTVESPGLDGILRLYAYGPIGQTESGPFIAVGLPLPSFYNQAYKDFRNGIIASLAIGILSVISGWYLGSLLIARVVIQMAKVDQLKQDFVSLVSHQLRTPLTAIKYFSQILLSGSPGKLSSTQRGFLNDTLESTNRLIFLVGTLLNISRLESGEIVLNYKRISLKLLLKEVYLQHKTFFSRKKLKVIIKGKPHSSYQVFADPKFISQVISNLLINAAKYSYHKTRVEVDISEKGNFVAVSIKNRGFGIKNSDKEFIFSKFFRSDDAKKKDPEGSGFGLYLNKLIIEAHGGKAWFTSTKGTTIFYFTLPSR